MALTITLTHDPARIDSLRSEWETLHEKSAADCIYLTWDWVSLWWSFFGKPGALWLLEAREDNGELVGLAPLMRVVHSPLFGVRWRQLQFISADSPCEHLDFIIQQGQEERVLAAFLHHLIKQRSHWDVLNLSKLSDCSPTLALLRTNSEIPWQEEDMLVAPVIYLQNDWETYFQSLASYKRRNQRRYTRDLNEKHPDWQWRLANDISDVDRTLDGLIELHQAFWTAQGHAGAFTGQLPMFHHQVARRFFERGWLRLSRLEINNQLVASLYTYEYRGRVYNFSMGVNQQFKDLNPGHIAIEMAIRESFKTGAREYDFLWGNESYKYAWGAVDRHNWALRWLASPRAQFEQRAIDYLRTGWHFVKRTLKSRKSKPQQEKAKTQEASRASEDAVHTE